MLSKIHETEFNRNKSLTSGETMSNKFNIFMDEYFMIFNSLLFPEFLNFTCSVLETYIAKVLVGTESKIFFTDLDRFSKAICLFGGTFFLSFAHSPNKC